MKIRPSISRPATLVAMCLAVSPPTGAASAGPESRGLLERARAALGGDWAGTYSGLRLRGTAEFLGQQGGLFLVFTSDGRFVRRVDAPLPDAAGFDGARVWSADWSGLVRELVLTERDWIVVSNAVVSGAWLRPHFPFEVRVSSTSTAEAPALEIGRADAPGAMTLRLDAATGLPSRLSRSGIVGEQVMEFGEFADVAGSRVPMLVRERTPGQQVTYRLDHAEPLDRKDAALAEGAFSAPGEPDDTRFDPAAPADLEVRRAPTGHFLVKPLVDGRDVGWFIFDTGAGNSTLSPAAAESLGLPMVAQSGVMSVYGFTPTPVRRGKTLTLGPLTVERPVFIDFDLSPFEHALGETVAGVMGYDVIRRAIVEIEVAENRIALHSRATFDTTGLPWRPLFLNDRHPIVTASFEGHDGLFKLDLGASGGPFGNVTMHAPAVERLRLLEGREVRKAQAAGGEVAFGRAKWFELAGHRFESPQVMFAADRNSGPFQDEVTLGNIGLDFMAPFRILLDYGSARIAMIER